MSGTLLRVGLAALFAVAVPGLLAAPASGSPAADDPSPALPLSTDVADRYPSSPCDPNGTTTSDSTIASQLNGQLTGTMAGAMTAYRVSCARMVVDTVRDRDLASRAAVIAITTTIVESTIQNINVELDHDSLGLFQQRASWGTAAQRLNPTWATNAFLDKMIREYPNNSWMTAQIGDVCQDVQGSKFPERYQPQAADAQRIVEALWSVSEPGGPAVVRAEGEYHLFGVSPSGQLSQNTWRPGGWLGWESLGGTVAGTPAVTYHDGQYDVFARSPRGVVYQKTWQGTWSDWKSLGGIIQGGLAAVYVNGEHHVFGISPSGQLSQNTWRNGSWLGWESLGGTVAGTPAVTYHDGQYDVFARSPRGVVYQKTWQGTWSDWKSIGGIVDGGLGAVYANGEYHVFGISPSGQLSQNTWRPGGWLGWESLGGTVAGTPAVTYHDGQYDVFARSPGGTVYQKTWQGTWSDWKHIGGTLG
ncbi:hypothetical protein [Verrucosispora sp. WMMC514]|uniref:hypothetical protein n=1 Tax=Verrucosispora sp. WMMC514 TaxID=3015156 RepID=UPI00248CB6DC|nr:hypothetical protein [Verrucosispora sp. WMMC514]WBB91211.1 hypothetical protein O7597_30360 [Verrucosispora sp. WMMC514]